MSIYTSIESFDYDSTESPVFLITVGPRHGYTGAFAKAGFRAGDDTPCLDSVVTWALAEEEALGVLLTELRERYGKL